MTSQEHNIFYVYYRHLLLLQIIIAMNMKIPEKPTEKRRGSVLKTRTSLVIIIGNVEL